jgi:hypothetical protein
VNFLTLPDAPCRGATHLFFPERGDFMSATRAKRVCAHCPHVEPCLQYALDKNPSASGAAPPKRTGATSGACNSREEWRREP